MLYIYIYTHISNLFRLFLLLVKKNFKKLIHIIMCKKHKHKKKKKKKVNLKQMMWRMERVAEGHEGQKKHGQSV